MPELGRLLFLVTVLAVALYFAVGLVVDAVVHGISFETEAKLFGAGCPDNLGETPGDGKFGRVKAVLETLAEDDAVPPLPFRLVVIPREQVNAFAFPGGTIGLTTAIMAELEKDIEFAFVLGHEIGHFRNRDHLRGLGRAIGVSVVYTVLFGGEMGTGSLKHIFQYVLHRAYSRAQENKADRFAVDLVFRVYGRTDGIDKLFKILQGKKDLPKWAYMFATHPSPSERIEKLKQYADEINESAYPDPPRKVAPFNQTKNPGTSFFIPFRVEYKAADAN
jgi:Zn-dependent protease with chaperone function